MAKKKTIGILAALVTADATQLRKEFASVDNTIRRSTTGWQKQLKQGLKLGAGIAGAQAGLSALTGEIQRVIANVERIPGINPQAVASIIEARTEFAKFRNTIDGGIASVLAFGTDLAKAVGAGAAMMMGASGDDVAAGLTKLETPDDVAAGQDDQYYDKVAAARSRLAEAQKKSAQAGMNDVEQIKALREEATRYETHAAASSNTSLRRLEDLTAAEDRSASAAQKLLALKKELTSAERALAESSFGAGRAHITHAQAMEGLKAKAVGLQIEMAELYRLMKEAPDDPAYIAAMTAKTKDLTAVNKSLAQEYENQNKWVNELGATMSGAFEDALLKGENLGDVVGNLGKQILAMFMKLAIINPLMNSLFSGASGWKALPSLFGFADGGEPPVGRPSLVGEQGPELFVPKTAGTIVPNHALGGSGGSTYYIDARGADRTGLARLEGMIRALNGSIEMRALGAVLDARRRGGAAA